MKYPNLKEERNLWRKGYKNVVCLDEAGRGPLAGPVVACAVSLKKEIKGLKGIKDSKELTKKGREKFFKMFVNHQNIEWGLGIVGEKVIDKINILNATKLAMKKALIHLKKKGLNPEFLILDGKMELDVEIPQISIIKADEKVLSCAIASIIAKVHRDKIMDSYDKDYPEYRFNKNKGYGTYYHYRALKRYGLSKIHRKSFMPIKLA